MDIQQLLTACSFSPGELEISPSPVPPAPAAELRTISDDSRAVDANSIFALTGEGAPYLEDALRRGPAVLLVTGGGNLAALALAARDRLSPQTTVLLAQDLYRAQGRLAAALHGNPSADLELVGITGTNGKTSTAWMLHLLWTQAGIQAGLIGTLGVRWTDRAGQAVELQTGYTTPRAGQLQELLGRMRADGVTRVAMEVSSEALVLGRLEGTRFACAVFTNLTPEHLNVHRTMDEYFAAKMRLFEMTARNRGEIVIYTGAPGGEAAARFATELGARVRTLAEPLFAPGELPVDALFHRINASLALAASGMDTAGQARARAALRRMPAIPGRYTVLRAPGADPRRYGIVDYAHSPDGLENVLRACREEGARTLVCVFGCGGDRDATKRPLMGAVAARFADVIIVTDDNPRSEDPAAIRAQVRAGILAETRLRAEKKLQEISEIGNRRQAIQAGVERVFAARETPAVVLVAGKGHENTQIFADRREPFSDQDVLAECLERAARSRPAGVGP